MNNIKELAQELGSITSDSEFAGESVLDVTHDSRHVRNGTLFVAIKGSTVDGHRFIDDVMRRGAAGIISEYDPPESFSGVWLNVEDVGMLWQRRRRSFMVTLCKLDL